MFAVSTGLQDLPCSGDCLLAFSEEKLAQGFDPGAVDGLLPKWTHLFCPFPPVQTKDVTTAMAEGKFDEAIKLRGKWDIFLFLCLKAWRLCLGDRLKCVSAK